MFTVVQCSWPTLFQLILVDIFIPLGSDETYGRYGDRSQRSSFLCGNTDYGFGRVQLNYNKSAVSSLQLFPAAMHRIAGISVIF